MSRVPPRSTPVLTVPLANALEGNETLGSLLGRVRESQRRLSDAREVLPPGLAAQVDAGPLDETGWTLLAPSGAAAAKLRQCLPAVQQHLLGRGWRDLTIRVKVHVDRKV